MHEIIVKLILFMMRAHKNILPHNTRTPAQARA